MLALRPAFASLGLLCRKDLQTWAAFIQKPSALVLPPRVLENLVLRKYFLIFSHGPVM